MESIDVLREEHRWIRRMVACLEKVVALYEETGTLDADSAGELVDLFATFSDSRHQEKEELLFPHLKVLASPDEEHLIDGLVEEHASDQGQLMHMRASLLQASSGDPVGEREFKRLAAEYCALHGTHMAKEGAVMFPLSDRLLTSRLDQELLQGFARIEARAPSTMERDRQRIETLCKRLGVDA